MTIEKSFKHAALAVVITTLALSTPAAAESTRSGAFRASLDESSLLTNFAETAIKLESCGILETDLPGFAEMKKHLLTHKNSRGSLYAYLDMDDPFFAVQALNIREKIKTPAGSAICEQGKANLAELDKAFEKNLHEFRRRHVSAGHANAGDPAYADAARQINAEKQIEIQKQVAAQEARQRRDEFENSPLQEAKRFVKLRDAIGSLPITGAGLGGRVLSTLFDDEITAQAEQELVADRKIDSVCDAVTSVAVPAAKGLIVGDVAPYVAEKKTLTAKGLKRSAKVNLFEAFVVALAGKSSDRCE